MVYLYNEILFSNKKEQTTDVYKMGEKSQAYKTTWCNIPFL